MKKLVLFDIDGTLIDPGGAGRRSLGHTFNEIFAIRDAFAGIKMAYLCIGYLQMIGTCLPYFQYT